MAAAQIIEHGTNDTRKVNSFVRPEVFILGGNGSVDQVLGYLVEGNRCMHPLIDQLSNQYTFTVVHFQIIAWQQVMQADYSWYIGVHSIVVEVIADVGASAGKRKEDHEQHERDTAQCEPEALEGMPLP